ncbi:MAG: 16S rRNA (cytosine(1402)-N(4))-methyltransferase RsmH [Alphaproteobacteria bacterium]|nr:16S rRNA (cytosine(1402)-N(4))-methyltransferase RsmH [Alphaproteobacteria bacterium]
MTLHQPVMLNEVLDALQPASKALIIDATFGRGGYSRAILEAGDGMVMAIDRDPDAIAAGALLSAEYDGRLTVMEGPFSTMLNLARGAGITAADAIVFDLGLSSPQLDEAERGFSFRHDGPLDMRMEKSGLNAADFINTATETEIARVIWEFGEERASRRIARAIVKARTEAPITRTTQLATIIRSVMPRPKPGQIDPATRSFQGIRIHINGELDEISAALEAAEQLLKPGGQLVVVSFHSLEDRLVKNFMITRSGQGPRPSRHRPDVERPTPSFSLERRKPVLPSETETATNPRARSARMRVATRTDAPAMKEVA